MRSALARHDDLIREAVTANGGHVVKSTGDGAYAVFDRAENAAAAAEAAQALFHSESLPKVGNLKVRMALHTGEADEREGDYFGTALNRAARLLGTGHGGQVLVSSVTKDVLGEQSYEFIDLGMHRLRDLTRPEHVHQLLYSGSPREFAPLKSVDAHPNNLPLQLTSFIGRESEVDELAALVGSRRLVTLTGVGGAGKTRLALQVAGELLDTAPNGAWFVDLAPISELELVVSQAAAPFGVRELETDPDRVLLDVLADYLSDKELVLLLDNCEHVLTEAARLAEQLLTRCPGVSILATSRGLLGVSGEAVFPVPPLGVSDDDEAVTLFVERASNVQPGFRLDDDNSEVILNITRKLEGLPLAIELAASRINVLALSEILSRLDDQLKLITSRRTEGRHSTLEAAMDWSYDLLEPVDQRMFHELSVFSGGWTLEAAEAVSGHSDVDVLETLAHLVDQSLVEVSDTETGRRYRLLEPVRQYAAAKLSEGSSERETRRRHASYFASFAAEGEQGLRGPDQSQWSLRIRADHDNIRSAIGWSLDAAEHEIALELTAAMGWFWWLRGHWKKALQWFHRVYDATPDADPVLRGRLVYKVASLEIKRVRPGEVLPLFRDALQMFREKGTAADVAWTATYAGEAEARIDLGRESVEIFKELRDSWGEAYSTYTYGQIRALGDDGSEGFAKMEQAVAMFLELEDRWAAAWMGFTLGHMYAMDADYSRARRVIEQSRDLVEGTNDRWIAPHCTSRLGVLATMTGATDEAKRLFSEALPVHQRIGDQNCTALINTYMGELMTDEGVFDTAAEHLVLGLEGYQDLQNRPGVALALRRAGWLAFAQGDIDRAVRILGGAETPGGAVSTHDSDRQEKLVAKLREMLDEERFEELWDEGKGMTPDEQIAYALGRQGV